jgi:hypothetical protein
VCDDTDSLRVLGLTDAGDGMTRRKGEVDKDGKWERTSIGQLDGHLILYCQPESSLQLCNASIPAGVSLGAIVSRRQTISDIVGSITLSSYHQQVTSQIADHPAEFPGWTPTDWKSDRLRGLDLRPHTNRILI